jgi:hypothetical protein
MKKIFSIFAIFVVITVLSLNLKMTAKSKNVAGIQLENLEALACYSLYLSEAGPLAPNWCCEPWYYFCYHDDWSGITFEGWPVY